MIYTKLNARVDSLAFFNYIILINWRCVVKFVNVNRIEPFLEAIKDRKEFIHIVKDGYQVIDYLFEDNDSFSDPYRLECRGIKFDLDGNLIGRPFHKFFNYGQKLITYDWPKPHRIMTKMDGSMVHSCIINNAVRLCTRMGITEQSTAAEEILNERQIFLLRDLNLHGYNAIFEYTAPDNRIVIDYEEKKLTLLAIRNIQTGSYYRFSYTEDAFDHIEEHNLSLADNNIDQIKEETTGIEGYVVAWPDGTYVKIKTNEYCQMHRAVSFFEREDMILPIILNSQCDDLYPNLSIDRAERLFAFESATMKDYLRYINDVKERVEFFKKSGDTRKDFALYVNARYPAGIRAAYFSALDGKDVKESVRNCILRNPDLLSVRW